MADCCEGILKENLPRLFDTPSAAVLPGGSDDCEGGGYALAIARGIVEAHRGTNSGFNQHPGCRFEVCLPLASD